MDEKELTEAAGALAAAEGSRVPIEPLTRTYPHIGVDDAYAIQRLNVHRRVASGHMLKGHKVGLTSEAMQRRFGIAEPDYGHLLDHMFAFEGMELERSAFISPQVECELAFVLARRIEGPGVIVADVARSVDFALPALEIIDSRIRDWDIRIQDTIADNGSSGAVILGGRPVSLAAFDPRKVGATVVLGAAVREQGTMAAVWGNPLTVVAWLANKLASFGLALEEGHVIMTGSATAAIPVDSGDIVRATIEGFGEMEVRFA